MADEMNGEREALQRALDVIERWARDAYVVCGKPATQDGFEAAWKAEDADAYEVWSAGRASLAANAGREPGASRAFLERALSAMEGVIDVADRQTDEFEALRSCVVDLTLMLFKPQACHPPTTSAEGE